VAERDLVIAQGVGEDSVGPEARFELFYNNKKLMREEINHLEYINKICQEQVNKTRVQAAKMAARMEAYKARRAAQLAATKV
jgi:hypothetical protein